MEISYCLEIFFVIPNKNKNIRNGEIWKKVPPEAFISTFNSIPYFQQPDSSSA